MKVSCTVTATRKPSGNIEILLQRESGSLRDGSKLHRQLFEVPADATAEAFLSHLSALKHSG